MMIKYRPQKQIYKKNKKQKQKPKKQNRERKQPKHKPVQCTIFSISQRWIMLTIIFWQLHPA